MRHFFRASHESHLLGVSRYAAHFLPDFPVLFVPDHERSETKYHATSTFHRNVVVMIVRQFGVRDFVSSRLLIFASLLEKLDPSFTRGPFSPATVQMTMQV
jgi:hypothetical protein